ncbi:MAG: ankyrin repeat domain-containing protein [Gammaproteobacteria bacterium]|nr:MAG: ankyrin repeat domain-containing protein [Gammaproteobacteria bacterium]UTW43491.1 hypothetical protein KFE69_05200 [bacterium SCSIO 12844]
MADILTLMKKNGYKIDEAGMCYGIAHVAIQSALRGKFNEYLTRLNQIQQIESKALNIQDETEREILAFFDAVLLYQSSNVEELSENDGDTIVNFADFYKNRQDPASGNKILNEIDDDSISQANGIYAVSKSLKIFSGETDNLKEYLNQLKGEKENFAALITISGHAMAIIFSNNCWHFVNHDEVKSIENEILSDRFVNDVLNNLPGYIATISAYADNNKLDHIRYSHDALKREVISTASQLVIYFNLACRDSHPDAARAFCELTLKSPAIDEIKKELLLATDESGKPFIITAFQNSDIDLMQAYAESIINANINNNLKKELLLLVRDDHDDPLIMMAFTYGQKEMIKAYFELIITSNLDDEVKKDLLLSNITNGNTLLHYAGYDADALKTLLDYIPANDRLNVILAKNNDGDTLLHTASSEALELLLTYIPKEKYFSFIAVRNHNGDTVLHKADAEKIKIILGHLPLDNHLSAILAINDNGDNVLHSNAYYPECLKSLFQYLPEDKRLGVIMEKNNSGATVIDYATYNDHAFRVLLAHLSETECLMLATEVRFDDGSTLLHHASAEILNAFLENIPLDMRLNVLLEKNHNGDSILSYAAPYIETLNSILDALPYESLISLVTLAERNDNLMYYVANHSQCLKAVLERVPETEIVNIITQTDDLNITPLVIASNYKDCLDVIFNCLAADELESVITLKDADGSSILHRAIFTDNLECFKMMLDALPKDKIISAISDKNNVGVSVLSYALSIEDLSYLNIIKEFLPEDQIKQIDHNTININLSNRPQSLFHNELLKEVVNPSQQVDQGFI